MPRYHVFVSTYGDDDFDGTLEEPCRFAVLPLKKQRFTMSSKTRSLQQGRPRNNRARTLKKSASSEHDALSRFLDRLYAMREDEIDYEIAPKTTAADWKNAEVLIPVDRETFKEIEALVLQRQAKRARRVTGRARARTDPTK